MGQLTKSIIDAPPLTKLPGVPRFAGGQDAITEVAALARQQAADLPASASPFEAVEPALDDGFSFSFSVNPADRIFDVTSAGAISGDVEKLEGQFKFTLRF
jgi:hypothetical protein